MTNKQPTIWDDLRLSLEECIAMTVDSIKRIEGIYDTWFLMWSGGKDSTTMVTMIIYLISTGAIKAPQKLKIFISDTRMELVPLWLNVLEIIDQLTEKGYEVEVVNGEIDNRFWVYMLGYGVPPPSNTFRWCTPKLKIDPITISLKTYMASRYDSLDESSWSKVLLMTGVRIGESVARDARINMSCSKDGSECGQGHYHHISNSWNDTLAPIIHYRTCLIWDWLMLYAPKKEFGGWSTRMLAEAYGDDEDHDNRTGCIGCNLASKDKALISIIRQPRWAYLSPLLKIRELYTWLKKPSQRLRKTGFQKTKSGIGSKNQNRMGPLTIEARKEGLVRLLSIINEVNTEALKLDRPQIDILNEEEISRIKEHWKMNSYPNGWSGTEVRADIPFTQYFKDGSSQLSIINSLR